MLIYTIDKKEFYPPWSISYTHHFKHQSPSISFPYLFFWFANPVINCKSAQSHFLEKDFSQDKTKDIIHWESIIKIQTIHFRYSFSKISTRKLIFFVICRLLNGLISLENPNLIRSNRYDCLHGPYWLCRLPGLNDPAPVEWVRSWSTQPLPGHDLGMGALV